MSRSRSEPWRINVGWVVVFLFISWLFFVTLTIVSLALSEMMVDPQSRPERFNAARESDYLDWVVAHRNRQALDVAVTTLRQHGGFEDAEDRDAENEVRHRLRVEEGREKACWRTFKDKYGESPSVWGDRQLGGIVTRLMPYHLDPGEIGAVNHACSTFLASSRERKRQRIQTLADDIMREATRAEHIDLVIEQIEEERVR